MRALENDEIFVDFITGNHDAFVIEDADHLLMARSNGNVDLHRFLAVADGVVRDEPAIAVALAAELRSITLAALYRLVDSAR